MHNDVEFKTTYPLEMFLVPILFTIYNFIKIAPIILKHILSLHTYIHLFNMATFSREILEDCMAKFLMQLWFKKSCTHNN